MAEFRKLQIRLRRLRRLLRRKPGRVSPSGASKKPSWRCPCFRRKKLEAKPEPQMLQEEESIPSPEQLTRDEFFLFSLVRSCEEAWARGQDTLPSPKDAAARAIGDILDRFQNFSFMKPPFEENQRTALLNVAFFPVYKLTQLSEDNEDLEDRLQSMLRGLLAEAPTLKTLSAMLEELSFYIISEEEEERDLAASSVEWLLAYAIRLPNLTVK
ncbi:uncharacterized protein LOC133374350 isoform X2 [Rhineura floridana]|uniref:uncharacterized protein LOC133374350 isoform X2 n=1 Tax=Rhineura floridana TaxID=261503 RepID=UPI002AC804E1|nr:uncharacterized protein LOC133374350 isoform X2 [Rhineura floridana]